MSFGVRVCVLDEWTPVLGPGWVPLTVGVKGGRHSQRQLQSASYGGRERVQLRNTLLPGIGDLTAPKPYPGLSCLSSQSRLSRAITGLIHS